jgi:mannosyl-3-phosphoglycerate phosphatase
MSPPFFLVFSDLDGTLLDHNTYGWEEAVPALELCKTRDVPVILASSKTRAEMDVFRRRLSLSAPFISENGGGIFFPGEISKDPSYASSGAESPGFSPGDATGFSICREKGLWKLSLGVSYPRLIKAFQEIRNELGWNMKGFSDMGVEEISRLTGLDKEGARLATRREYDEPFIIEGEEPTDLTPLIRAAEQRGLLITSGGRFYHLQGKNDKAKGVELITAWYKKYHRDILTVALGDSPNDFGMLEWADFPVLIRSQRSFPDLIKRIPRLRITDDTGPKGWNSAVINILREN